MSEHSKRPEPSRRRDDWLLWDQCYDRQKEGVCFLDCVSLFADAIRAQAEAAHAKAIWEEAANLCGMTYPELKDGQQVDLPCFDTPAQVAEYIRSNYLSKGAAMTTVANQTAGEIRFEVLASDKRNALSLASEADGWRPISTRPMDGTRYLAVCASGLVRLVRQADPDDRLPIGDQPGGAWPDLPTHWMPLPQPPSSTAADGAALPVVPQGYRAVPIKKLVKIASLIDPAPIEVDGKRMVFKNQMAAEVLTRLSAEIRELLEHRAPDGVNTPDGEQR